MGGPSPRQARWHELFSKFDHHVVYTPGPVNPVGDFLSHWAYPANPALGDVSIHGTAQAARDVRDMMAAKKEELPARPLVFRAVVAPVVTRSKAAPRAQGAPACDPTPLASAPVVSFGFVCPGVGAADRGRCAHSPFLVCSLPPDPAQTRAVELINILQTALWNTPSLQTLSTRHQPVPRSIVPEPGPGTWRPPRDVAPGVFPDDDNKTV